MGNPYESCEPPYKSWDVYHWKNPGDLASEAEAFRIEVLAKQDDGEYGAVTGAPSAGSWGRKMLGITIFIHFS